MSSVRQRRRAAAQAAVVNRTWSRLQHAPGFDLEAQREAVLFHYTRPGDRVSDHLLLRAGGMGVGRILVTGPSVSQHARAESTGRLASTTPAVASRALSQALWEHRLRHAARQGPAAAVIHLGNWLPLRTKLDLPDDVPRRFYCCSASGIHIGSSPAAVAEAMREHHVRAAPGRLGLERLLAAALLLGFAEAAFGVWTCPRTSKRMPMPPRRESLLPLVPSGRIHPVPIDTLFVGAGALGHASSEALVRDPINLRSMRGGRHVVCDGDHYEEHNLPRQQVATRADIHRNKARVVVENLRSFFGLDPRIELIAEPRHFEPEMIERHFADRDRPLVVVVGTDTAASRKLVNDAVRERPGTLVVNMGTTFTYGQTRSVIVGEGCCPECGPEMMSTMVRAEARLRERRRARAGGCSAEFTPSNILTNFVVGCLAMRDVKRFVLGLPPLAGEQRVSWAHPSRVDVQPAPAPCGCWGRS